jgi:hypothetical protein
MLVSRIPSQILQGDSATWADSAFADDSGNSFNSANSTLKYTISGPATPLVLTATASGTDWTTTLTTVQSATLTPGTYWWQMQAFATGVRFTAAQGELLVKPDLAAVGTNYDGRSVAEIALAQARAAYATFSASGGVMKMYRIGSREMSFQDLSQIREQVDYWSAQVAAEKATADGAKSRRLHIRFDRIR